VSPALLVTCIVIVFVPEVSGTTAVKLPDASTSTDLPFTTTVEPGSTLPVNVYCELVALALSGILTTGGAGAFGTTDTSLEAGETVPSLVCWLFVVYDCLSFFFLNFGTLKCFGFLK